MDNKNNQNFVTIEQLVNTLDMTFHNLDIKTTPNNIEMMCIIDHDIKGIKNILKNKDVKD